MKISAVCLFLFVFFSFLSAEPASQAVKLNPPNLDRGLPVMKALSQRASVNRFSEKPLALQDLSDLLWAANGINRADSGKRTAPSALNAHDIDIYVLLSNGTFLYEPKKHVLEPVTAEDCRKLAAGMNGDIARAPVICLLVSDVSRFPFGDASLKLTWGAEDAGIVSQNICVFCASVGLSTRPRASMDVERLKKVLSLKDTQHPMLNNPVSYAK